jgi:hypothetical protein
MQKGKTRFTLRHGEPVELLVYEKRYKLDADGLIVSDE